MTERPRKRLRATALLVLLTALPAAGCWDKHEIDDLSNSLTTGVDLCAPDEACEIVSTRQIAIPGRVPLGAGQQPEEGVETVFILRSPGEDGPDSARRSQAQLNHPLSFGHTRVILLGEPFAQAGIASYLDYMRRQPELRRLMWIAVSVGRAEAVIRAQPTLDPVPALYLNDLIEDAVNTGRLPSITLGEFLSAHSNHGQDGVAPLIRMAGPSLPALAGLAVFRGDRMVGTLTLNETATFLQLRGRKRAVDLLRLRLDEGGWADLFLFGRSVRHEIRLADGSPSVIIKLDLEGDLYQLSPGLSGRDPAQIAQIEEAASDEVRRRAVRLLERLQHELGADILSVGERVRARLPTYWRSVGDWREAYATVRFTVEAQVELRRTSGSTE